MAQRSRKKEKETGAEPPLSGQDSSGSSTAGPAQTLLGKAKPLDPPYPSPIGTTADYDSGWVFDKKHDDADWSVRINHNLGVLPSLLTLWFSPDGGLHAYPVQWRWDIGNNGNPVTIEVTDRQILLHESKDHYVHGVWLPERGWCHYTRGYWRVFAWR